MKISGTARGRRGTLSNGVGKLVLTATDDRESRILKLLYDEAVVGNLWFWAPIIWAVLESEIGQEVMNKIKKVIQKVQPKFEKYLEQGG